MAKVVVSCASACLFILALGFVAAESSRSVEASMEQGLRLVKSDAQSVVMELLTPAYDIEETRVEGSIYHVVSVPGYAQSDRVGHPQLPLEGALLGIPPHAQVDLHILEAEGDIIPGDYNLSPVPRLIAEYDPSSDLVVDAGAELVQDQSVYSVNSFYPADLARISSSGFIRDQRFLHVQIYPFQYNPVTRHLKFYQRVLVEISFSYPEGATLATGGGETGGPFEATLRNGILNYESARGWRERSTRPALLEASTMDAGEDRYKIAVAEEGIYQLDYADLEGAGVPVDPPGFVDPRNFHIYNRGEEIAIYVHGEEDGGFQLGDYILFYGQPADTKYSNTNIYWFTAGGASGRRMEAKSGEGVGTTPTWFTATARLEEGHLYYGWLPFAEAEHWYWEWLQPAGVPVTGTYTIDLNNIYAGEAYSPTLRAELWGWTSHDGFNPDHHALIYVNDYLVEDAWWDGQTGHQVDVGFPEMVLLNGQNVIKVVCPGDTGAAAYQEVVLTDWFEIDYRNTHVAEDESLTFAEDDVGTWEYEISNFSQPSVEVYDVTEPISVSRIVSTTIVPVGPTYTLTFTRDIASPARYLALTGPQTKSPAGGMTKDSPSDLRDPSNGADYVIITHSDFYDNVLPLVDPDRPAVQGLRTTVVDVQDIYDEFSYGIFSPQAIKDFLAYTYSNWVPPAPSYILLVGDGNYDFKDNYGYGEPNYVPPYLACVDPEWCEAATDNWYACVNGPDIFPDMHIGRLPVKTAAEADAVISKILIYEQAPLADWRSQALFVADDPDPEAGDFPAISDYIADNHLPPFYSAEKVYYGVSPHTTPSDVTTAIIDGINEGRLLVNYFGHGAQPWWGGEMFLAQYPLRHDLDLLTNSERLPLVLHMSCYIGDFAHPSPPGSDSSCLSESLVRAEAKGAVASWASTGVGHAEGHKLLETGFFDAVFTDGVLEVGAAATQAKYGMDSYQYLIELYTLLGDPAMRLAIQYYELFPLILKDY